MTSISAAKRIVFKILILSVLVVTTIFASSVSTYANPYPIKVAGERHTLVLLSDGTVVGWGQFNSGELGPVSSIPHEGFWSTAFVSIKLPRKAIDIATAESVSFAVLDDGSVVSWGGNRRFLLGIGEAGNSLPLINNTRSSENPVKISNLSDIVQISASYGRAIALRRDGTVHAWGGAERKTAVQIPGIKGIVQISASGTHSMALDSSGSVWTWGDPLYGSLGRMSDGDRAEKVPGIESVVSIAAGMGVSTVVKKDGSVWVWGSNFNAQFGDGKRTDAPIIGGLSNKVEITPREVAGVRNAVSITSGFGGRHTIVLLKDGTLRGWGNSDWGQVGAGVSGTFQQSPILPKITNVKAVFAAENNSYAVKNDNSFWIWGKGDRGRYPLTAVTKFPVRLELFRVTP